MHVQGRQGHPVVQAIMPPLPLPALQAYRLQSLVLRCSHASIYADTQSMESLSKLLALTSLRMGPNPDDQTRQRSPLGFARLPSFISALSGLQHLDITMADAPTSASLSTLDFAPIQHLPNVKLVLRADTSIRVVTSLPSSLAQVTGLRELVVQVARASLLSAGAWAYVIVLSQDPWHNVSSAAPQGLAACCHAAAASCCIVGSATLVAST